MESAFILYTSDSWKELDPHQITSMAVCDFFFSCTNWSFDVLGIGGTNKSKFLQKHKRAFVSDTDLHSITQGI